MADSLFTMNEFPVIETPFLTALQVPRKFVYGETYVCPHCPRSRLLKDCPHVVWTFTGPVFMTRPQED